MNMRKMMFTIHLALICVLFLSSCQSNDNLPFSQAEGLSENGAEEIHQSSKPATEEVVDLPGCIYTLYTYNGQEKRPVGSFALQNNKDFEDEFFPFSISLDSKYAFIGRRMPAGGEEIAMRPYLLDLHTGDLYNYNLQHLRYNAWLDYRWGNDGLIYPSSIRGSFEFESDHVLQQQENSVAYYYFDAGTLKPNYVFFNQENVDKNARQIRHNEKNGDWYIFHTAYSGDDPMTVPQNVIFENRNLYCSVYNSAGKLKNVFATGIDWTMISEIGYSDVLAEFTVYDNKIYFSHGENWGGTGKQRTPATISIKEYDPYSNTHRSIYTYNYYGEGDRADFGNVIQSIKNGVITAYIHTEDGRQRIYLDLETGEVTFDVQLPELSSRDILLGEDTDSGRFYVLSHEFTRLLPDDFTKIENIPSDFKVEAPTDSFTTGIPRLSDLSKVPIIELPFTMTNDLWDTELELGYKAELPKSSFATALQSMDDNGFATLFREKQVMIVGDHIIYYTSDSSAGPARITVEYPNGSTQNILTSSRGIGSMCFASKDTIRVEVITRVHMEANAGHYYNLNITTGEFRDTGIEAVNSPYMETQTYAGNIYRLEESADTPGLGCAYDIYLYGGEKWNKIAEHTVIQCFENGTIYYLGRNPNEINKMDMDGDNKSLWKSFDTEVKTFDVQNNILFYRTENSSYVEHLSKDSVVSLDGMRSYGRVYLDDGGAYYVDAQNIMWFCGFDNATAPILSKFTGNLKALTDGWIYFSYAQSDADIVRRCLFKVRHDGTQLTLLNAVV